MRIGVVVTILIDKAARIPRDVEVALDRGLVGEATLAFRTRPLAAGAVDPGVLGEGETLRATATGMMDQIVKLLDEKLGGFAGAAVAHAIATTNGFSLGDVVEKDKILKTVAFIFLAPSAIALAADCIWAAMPSRLGLNCLALSARVHTSFMRSMTASGSPFKLAS